MNAEDPAPDVLESTVHGDVPMPVTPGTGERREGVAFEVEPGTKMPGVPEQPTAPNEEDTQTVHEKVEVPPGGLHLPGTDG